MEFDSRSYWKPRDLAALLDVSPSRVRQLIEDGELELAGAWIGSSSAPAGVLRSSSRCGVRVG